MALAPWLLLASADVRAAEATRVATAFEDKNPFDIHFGVTYTYNYKRAAILREWNTGASQDARTVLAKDLIYRQQRHVLTPTLEIGLWHDLAIYAQLPVVLADFRDYGFDQRGSGCVFGGSADATCVDKFNSTTVRDGILPSGGFDGRQPSAPFSQFTGRNTVRIFNGPVRRGLDQLWLGIKYGVFNQDKRPHLPTWVIAAEGRFAVGRAMTFSRDTLTGEPDGNGRVGRRTHELGFWTTLSRRFRVLDPYVTAYWRQSLAATGSQFQDLSRFGAQTRKNPQSTAGLSMGTEFVALERKGRSLKVSVLLEGSAALHYGGRAYSEVWELLADSPALVGPRAPTDAAGCDRNAAMAFAAERPGDPGYVAAGGPSCVAFNGVTDVQNYGTFGVQGAFNFHLGPYVRMLAGANLQTATQHFLTFTERGKPKGGTSDLRVEPGTREVNPLRRDVIDDSGRRYAIDDVFDLQAYLRLLVTF